jgi:aminomethyltransferase
MFTNETGGILDDLMMANRGDHLFLVVNAACKADDIAHMRAGLPGVEVEEITTARFWRCKACGGGGALCPCAGYAMRCASWM